MRPDEALNWMLCYCSIEETKVKFTLDYYEFEIRIFEKGDNVCLRMSGCCLSLPYSHPPSVNLGRLAIY